MRKPAISAASLCLLVVALASPMTAQGGGKKKHAADSSQAAQTVQTDQTVETPVQETTGIRRDTGKNGQIIINWLFKDRGGYANLIVNKDGSYVYSGSYDNKKPGKSFDAILAVRTEGAAGGFVFEWYHAGDLSKGGITWSVPGQSDILRENFRSLSVRYAWGGAYRFPSLKELKEWESNNKRACAGDAWMNKQEWARVDPGQICHQFNDKLY